jgi:hypothetical protein
LPPLALIDQHFQGGQELSPTELEALSSLTTYLSKVSGAPPESGINVLEKMMVNWPPAKQFPGLCSYLTPQNELFCLRWLRSYLFDISIAIDIVRTMSISVLPAQLLPCLLSKIRELNDQPGTELNFTLAVRALHNGLASCPITTRQPTLINKPDLAKQICDLLSSESSPKLDLTTKNAKVAFATLLLKCVS